MTKVDDWARNAIIVTVTLVVVCSIIYSVAQTNPLFAAVMIGGGGVLGAIVAKAKGFF